MRIIINCCIVLVLFASACSDDSGGRAIEHPYAVGHIGSRVISVSSSSITFEHDFIFYDEKGVMDASRFTIEEGTRSFSGGLKFGINVKDVTLLNAEAKGCYNVAVLTEQNAMERPERPEQLARYIFKNTPACSNFALGVYPDRDASLASTGQYKVIGSSFVNDPNMYDQNLAAVASNNYLCYSQGRNNVDSQLRGLEAMAEFVADNATTLNKNVFVMYQNFSENDTGLSDAITDYAISNKIKIHAIKNDFDTGDVILRMAHATGGIYFMPDDYDPFHVPARSDYYATALHADKFLSGNYSFYRATYEINANTDYFDSGSWFAMTFRMILDEKNGDDNIVKLVPCYVSIP